jgi:hypothetical protein
MKIAKINELPNQPEITGNEQVPVAAEGASKKVSISQLDTYFKLDTVKLLISEPAVESTPPAVGILCISSGHVFISVHTIDETGWIELQEVGS